MGLKLIVIAVHDYEIVLFNCCRMSMCMAVQASGLVCFLYRASSYSATSVLRC